MSILDLSYELILLIADHLTSPTDIHHLLLTHRGLASFLSPVLSKLATQPAYCTAALFCFAANRNPALIHTALTAHRKPWDPHITTADVNRAVSAGPNLIFNSPSPPASHPLIPLPHREQRALHWAVANEHLHMISHLLHQGAELEYRDPKTGGRAIDHAIRQGSAEIVALLINAGADVNAWERKCGGLLHCTIDCMRRVSRRSATEARFRDILRLLVAAGVDLDLRDIFGHTALHLAVLCWDEAAKVLLDGGADPNAQDNMGNTPLHLAAMNLWVGDGLVKVLLERGADPTRKNLDGNMPNCLAEWRAAVGAVAVSKKLASARGLKTEGCRRRPSSANSEYQTRLLAFRP